MQVFDEPKDREGNRDAKGRHRDVKEVSRKVCYRDATHLKILKHTFVS